MENLVSALCVVAFLYGARIAARFYFRFRSSNRRLVARFVTEELLLQSGTVKHEEEYVEFDRRTLYRQIWSPVDPMQVKAVVVYAHGLHGYSGKLSKIVPVICLT